MTVARSIGSAIPAAVGRARRNLETLARWAPGLLMLGMLLGSSAVAATAVAAGSLAASNETHRVVVLYDERTDLPGLAAFDESLVRILVARSPAPIEIYREEMDLSRVGSASYSPNLRDHLRAKYAGKKIDLAIAVMGPSLDFLLHYGNVVFPAVPIVFGGLDARELRGRVLPANATGVMVSREFAPTLELAQKLHPDTKRVVFVAGTSEFDTRLVDEAREQLRAFEGRFEFAYLTALPMQELLKEVSKLPPHSIVLYSTLFRDGEGKTFVPHEVVERISAFANAPVYGFLDQYLGHGIVGGRLYSVSAHGEEAAKLALQVLAGKPPSSMPPVTIGASATMLDWRQLRRWGISESQLPPEAVVRFRPSSLWTHYKGYVIGATFIVVLQTLLISGLVLQLSRRRRAESAFKDSEERFRLAADAAHLGMWGWNRAHDRLWATENCRSLHGLPQAGEITYRMFTDVVHPEDRETIRRAVREALRDRVPFVAEYRVVLPAGDVRWIATRGRGSYHGGLEPTGVLGVAVDVSERKQAEETLRRKQYELEHVGRVSTMGEIAGSLAHELSQPLAAILSNAQAGLRFIERGNPDPQEIREILQDVVADDKRAGEVVGALRSMLRRGKTESAVIDVAGAARDVLALLHSELVAQQVEVETGLEPGCFVIANKTQIEQVLLNLVMNGIDAMRSCAPAERRLRIEVSCSDGRTVRVAVRDSGVGIPGDELDRVFEAFWTTKPSGMGMGLAVCSSIVKSCGGELKVEPNAGRGVTFSFTLPLASQPVAN